jgi:hypothetical protein
MEKYVKHKHVGSRTLPNPDMNCWTIANMMNVILVYIFIYDEIKGVKILLGIDI